MSLLSELLLNSLTGTLAEIGEQKLEEVLQKLHDTKPELYKTTLKAGLVFCDAIQLLVDKSKSKIDDAVIAGIRAAIVVSAEANGVDLALVKLSD